jgi:hypothetical protein
MKANLYFVSTALISVLLVVSPPAFARRHERVALGKVADRVFREFEHISSIAGADCTSPVQAFLHSACAEGQAERTTAI